MKIGEKAGIVSSMCRKITPFLSRLFPSVPKESKAMEYIALMLIANFLGLGWASTPAGLKAMEELQKYNPHKEKATTAMCGFMILICPHSSWYLSISLPTEHSTIPKHLQKLLVPE